MNTNYRLLCEDIPLVPSGKGTVTDTDDLLARADDARRNIVQLAKHPGALEGVITDLRTEVARLQAQVNKARLTMGVVVSSPVCHPHNRITLRDAIAELEGP